MELNQVSFALNAETVAISDFKKAIDFIKVRSQAPNLHLMILVPGHVVFFLFEKFYKWIM